MATHALKCATCVQMDDLNLVLFAVTDLNIVPWKIYVPHD